MPIYSIEGPDGKTYSIEGPAGATREEVIRAIQMRMQPVARAPEPERFPMPVTPTAAPTQRSFGEAALDIPAAALSGLGGLLQFPGQVVKMLPGLTGVGQALEKPGELVSEAGDYLKSEGLKAREALRSKAISEAEKDGILSAFGTAIVSTIKDPALITTFLAEQVPLLLGPAGAAKLTQKLGAKAVESAGAGLTGDAAKEAVKVASEKLSKKAYGAAYGTGAAMQAADVSSDAYEEALRKAREMGLSEDDAQSKALAAGRVAGLGAGAVALLAQRLPGAKAIEQRLAGVPGTAGKLGSAVGEGISEAVEEGGGQVFKNLGLRQIDPNQSLTEGVGGAAGLGALGGGMLGGILGKKAEEARFEGQREGESDREFAARLQREIAAGIRPPEPPPAPAEAPAAPVIPTDQQLFTLAAQPNGYGLLENLKQKISADESIPAADRSAAVDNIRNIQARMNIEQVERLRPMGQPPAPLLPTDEEARNKAMEMDLNKLGTIVENMGSSVPTYQKLLADPEALKKEAKKGKLSVEEARARYQEHIEYINSVLPVYTQVLQQRKQQQQQTKEAEQAQAIANLTPEQQAIRSQAESLIKELEESGVPEFVNFAEGAKNNLPRNNFKTEKDIELLKSKVESYRNLKQSAEAAKPVDEISLESLNENYPDDLAKIQEASKDPRLADLFARVNDAMNRSAKAINALGMSWSGIDSRSSPDIQNVRDIVSGMGGGVGRLVNIKEAIDKNYNRASNDPAKLGQAIRDVEADIETANQRIAKVQALAPAAAPTAPPAAPVQEKVKKIEGPKPKGMPVRAKELPQPKAPPTPERVEAARMETSLARAERQRNAVINKSKSLWSVLVGKLNAQEVNDINPERRFKVLRAKTGVMGDSISTFVANGDLDPWLPPDRRLGAQNYDEYDNTEYIKDLLRGGKENYITHDTKVEAEKIFGSVLEMERAIKDLLSIEEANEAINTAREEQGGLAEEAGPTVAEIENRGAPVVRAPEEEPTVRVLKSLGEVKPEKAEIPPEIQKKIDLLEKVLRKNLAKFGLKDVDLNLEQGMTDEGSFSGQLIRIALDSPDPLGILRHESIHALKEAGFFTDKQWASLEKAADEKWIDQFLKGQEVEYEGQRMSRYDAYMKEYGGNVALIREEAIADAFRSFSKKKPAGLMGALTERMKNFFKAVKQTFNSQGIESAEDIFGKIEEGKLEAAPAKAEKPGEELKSLRAPNTEAFKKWFGDSKVVDENGEPLVVYHGTTKDFTSFDREKATEGRFGAGFYFGGPTTASRRADVEGGRVLPVYLNISNPAPDEVWSDLRDKMYSGKISGEKMRSSLEEQGYDGIILRLAGGSSQYVAFRPEQIKSATGNIGTFEPTSPDIRKSLRSSIGLYSELENKIESVSSKAAPAAQWKTMINALTQKGVKPEEIEWSGVNDWLSLQEGKVAKDELLNYLRANGVQVEEVVLGEKIDEFNEYLEAKRASEEAGGNTDVDAISKMPKKMLIEEEEKLLEAWERYTQGGPISKYGTYTLPGGENYREILLRLPTDFERKSKPLEKEIRALGITSDLGDISVSNLASAGASEDLINRFRDALQGSAEKSFSSVHWDEPNILAHIRVNDRTDADGNKVLFVEEIQSDWGQAGKKTGFYDAKDVGTREEYLAAKNAAKDVIKRTDNLGFDWWADALNAIRELGPKWRNNFSFDTEEDARVIDDFLRAEARELRRVGGGKGVGVPAAPFVTKTEGWLNLALKRIMVLAAKGNYDKVAFVNGDQSAERYDLSKQIDRIDAKRRGKDSYDIDVSTKEGKDFNRSGLSAADLEDQVGKEMAQKIIDATTEQDKPVRFSGLELKIGGEGMKTFYDSIVPNTVKKLLPKVGGGQFKTVKLGQDDWTVRDRNDDLIAEGFSSEESARQYAADYSGATVKNEGGPSEQPGFDVTPAMREKVATTGLPKFSLRSMPVIDPDTQSRINDTIRPRKKEGFVDRIIDAISAKTFSRFREELINHYNEAAELDKRVAAEIKAAGGAEQMANEKAEVAALFSDQAAAVASSALGAHNRKGGIPVYRNGIVTVDTSGDNEGPVVIFAPLASTGNPETFQHYQFWAAVNRAAKYFGDTSATRYKERLFTEDDVKRAKELYEGYLAEGIDFKDIQKRWTKYNNGLVKLMKDTGTISERAASDFTEHGDYFPFYRQVNEEEMTGPKTFSTIAGTKPPKAAKGSEEPLGDFFETVVRNTQAAITLAMKNVAAQRITSQALRINEVVRLSENPQVVQTSAGEWDVYDSQYADTISAANEASALAAARSKYGANATVSEGAAPGKWNVFKAVKIGDVAGDSVQEARQNANDYYKYRPSAYAYKVLENGQPVYYQAYDVKLINALKALNMNDLPFIGLLSAPANALRTLVTKEPGYMLVNQMRDSMSAWVTSGVKMTPVVDSARQFARSIAKTSPEMEALFNAGVIGGYEYAHGARESGAFLEKEIRRKAGVKSVTEKITTPFTSLWGALERGTQISDGATRAEVYKRVLAETGNEAEALWQAAEVLNFYRHGRSPVIRVLTATIPFLNSRIQGLDVLYRAGIRPALDKMSTDEQRQRMKTFWTRGMTMMAVSAMYWMLTHDDDEYKKQEQETRDNYWLIPSLGIKIAIPFEVGVLFKVLPERILQNAFGTDTGKESLESFKRQLQSTLMFTFIPQAFLPYYEVSTNFSFFTQRPIIGKGMEDVAPRFQVSPGTSGLAQLIADKLRVETTNDSSAFTKSLAKQLEISPIKLDHMIKGYTGTIGQYAVELFDAIYNMNNDVPKPSKRFEQLPIIKRLALDPNARGTVTSYYDLKNSVDEVTRTSNLLERTMNAEQYGSYLRQNIGILANKEYISAMEKSMKELREAKLLIRYSKMDEDRKRDAILSIEKMENQLTSNIQTVRKKAYD